MAGNHTRHSADCRRVFNRYDHDCPRCQELADGAEPRRGWGRTHTERRVDYARFRAALAAHDCAAAGCGPVCTFGDW